MKKSTRWRQTAMAVLVGVLVNTEVCAKEVKTVTYSPHAAIPSCLMNMGPTGARAWMRGYHFVVIEIDLYSPAAGRLEPADVVIAADGNTFSPKHDPRKTLGDAIGRGAEQAASAHCLAQRQKEEGRGRTAADRGLCRHLAGQLRKIARYS